jgi:hypothetical protein
MISQSKRNLIASIILISAVCLPIESWPQALSPHRFSDEFLTASHCTSCHSDVKTPEGEDASIVFQWRASIMANASRDPYWQGSVRRETTDHPGSSSSIENDCGSCHAPAQYQIDKAQGQELELFKHLDFTPGHRENTATADGVTCTVCHQIQAAGLNTSATFNGNFSVASAGTQPRPVYGPFVADPNRVVPVHVASVGYAPTQGDQIRQAGLCGSCHTLYTTSLAADGKELGKFPEQVPYLEWQHSDYVEKQTCQQCHMPAVGEPVAVATQLAGVRDGVRRHFFIGGNFFMQEMLNAHSDELSVTAQPEELTDASTRTRAFLQSQAASVSLETVNLSGGRLTFAVRVKNLTGHKLPTAYPSRRAWLHVVVTRSDGEIIFESGRLNPDGSIVGNANDVDPTRFSPHFSRITRADQVEIFEPILGDSQGHVTTGLLSATQYLKDNRILPAGFVKRTASADIAVRGEAAVDPGFIGGSATTRYEIDLSGAKSPISVAVELDYQPIGYRWAHNLAPYKDVEPQRFVQYFDQAAGHSAIVLAHTESTVAKEGSK